MQHSLICTTLMMKWTLFIHILSNTHQQFKHFQYDPFTDTTKEVYSMDDNFFITVHREIFTSILFSLHCQWANLRLDEFKYLNYLSFDKTVTGRNSRRGETVNKWRGQKLLGAKITMHTLFGQNNSDLLQSQTSQNIDIFFTIFSQTWFL